MYREDYLLRLIQQLVQSLARIAGLNRSGKHDEALAASEDAWDRLLDAPRGMIAAIDTPTLAMLLREPAKMRVAAQLCYEEARALGGTERSPEGAGREGPQAPDQRSEGPSEGDGGTERSPEGAGREGPQAPDQRSEGPSEGDVLGGHMKYSLPARKGDPVQAALRYRRALELILEARALDPQPEDDEAILELRRHVPVDTLDARYRQLL
jgi:hypothetical protein